MRDRNTFAPGNVGSPPGADVNADLLCVFNKTEESFLALNVIRSGTPTAWLRGLLGRPALKSGEGMWMEPAHAFHNIGMLFAMDVIYLDAENRVIHTIEHRSPFSISSLHLKSASILQLPLHTIHRSQTHVGDMLLICRPEEMQVYLRKSVSQKESISV